VWRGIHPSVPALGRLFARTPRLPYAWLMVAMLGLPSWVPWWLPLLVLVPGVAWLLAMLPMPFAVLGLRGRLEGIEARLDELQQEIRTLALRMPEPDPGSHRIPVPPRREVFTPPYPDGDEVRPAAKAARGGDRPGLERVGPERAVPDRVGPDRAGPDRAGPERQAEDRPRDRQPPDPSTRPRRLEPRFDFRR
jgi:hypothetical protein